MRMRQAEVPIKDPTKGVPEIADLILNLVEPIQSLWKIQGCEQTCLPSSLQRRTVAERDSNVMGGGIITQIGVLLDQMSFNSLHGILVVPQLRDDVQLSLGEFGKLLLPLIIAFAELDTLFS
jgi:hypothetical protein